MKKINEMWFKLAIFALNGNEQIKGINPKLMKDIICNRELLCEKEGLLKFKQAIGTRRFLNIIESDLLNNNAQDKFKLKIIELTISKKIAELKLEAYQDPFSNAPTQLKFLKELQDEFMI